MTEVTLVAMEDLSLEDLITDVVASPVPQRVPCEPTPQPAVATNTTGLGAFFRRLFGR